MTSESREFSYLSSEDLEMLILASAAIWGDGGLDSNELDNLYACCEVRIPKLELAPLTQPSDIDLSTKEYLVTLFDKIKAISSDSALLEKIEVHQKFRKAKGKQYQATDQISFFNLMLDELAESYEGDRSFDFDKHSEVFEALWDEIAEFEEENLWSEEKILKSELTEFINNFPLLAAFVFGQPGDPIPGDLKLHFWQFVRAQLGKTVMIRSDTFLGGQQFTINRDNCSELVSSYTSNAKKFIEETFLGSDDTSHMVIAPARKGERLGLNKGLDGYAKHRMPSSVLSTQERFGRLSRELEKLLKINGVEGQEKDLIAIMDIYAKSDTSASGCLASVLFVIVVAGGIWWFFN